MTEELPEIPGYRVLRRAGSGANGEVLEAEDERLGRRVALKVFRFDADTDVEGRARFVREARLLAQLPHPALVPVYDAQLDRDPPFMASAWMAGGDLEARLGSPEFRDPARVLAVGRRLAEALAHLHENGILHRDVKPANVLLDEEGEAYLTDLGLGRREDVTDLTATGTVVGTPLYMPPEVLLAGDYSPRADLFALGATLLALVRGTPFPLPPFDPRLVDRALAELPPGELRDRLTACLAADPAARPATAEEAFDGEARPRAAGAPPITPSSPRAPPPPDAPSRRPRLPLLLATIAFLLAAGLGWTPGTAPADQPGVVPATPGGVEAEAREALRVTLRAFAPARWPPPGAALADAELLDRYLDASNTLRIQRFLRAFDEWERAALLPPPDGPGGVEAGWSHPEIRDLFLTGGLRELARWCTQFRDIEYALRDMLTANPLRAPELSPRAVAWNQRHEDLKEALLEWDAARRASPPPGPVLTAWIEDTFGNFLGRELGAELEVMLAALEREPRPAWAEFVARAALDAAAGGDLKTRFASCADAAPGMARLRRAILPFMDGTASSRREPPLWTQGFLGQILKTAGDCKAEPVVRETLREHLADLPRLLENRVGWKVKIARSLRSIRHRDDFLAILPAEVLDELDAAADTLVER